MEDKQFKLYNEAMKLTAEKVNKEYIKDKFWKISSVEYNKDGFEGETLYFNRQTAEMNDDRRVIDCGEDSFADFSYNNDENKFELDFEYKIEEIEIDDSITESEKQDCIDDEKEFQKEVKEVIEIFYKIKEDLEKNDK